jgi:hypothetical protein
MTEDVDGIEDIDQQIKKLDKERKRARRDGDRRQEKKAKKRILELREAQAEQARREGSSRHSHFRR